MILMVVSLATPPLSRGQSVSTTEAPAPATTYHLLREDDDWSFLADPTLRRDFWDPIKYIRLRPGRNNWFLSIGGEAREVWEQIGNDNWGQQPSGTPLSQRTVHGLFRRSLRQARSVVRGVQEWSQFLPHRWSEADRQKKLDFQAAFLEVERGMNATGSKSEPADTSWNMARGA